MDHQLGNTDPSMRSSRSGIIASEMGESSGRKQNAPKSQAMVMSLTRGVMSSSQRAGWVGDQVLCRLTGVAAEGGVGPVVVGTASESRDQHIGRQHGVRDPRRDERHGDEPLPGHQARARHGEVEADPGDQQAHVFLDQEQGRQRDQRGPQPTCLQALQRDRGQYRGERDLMEVEVERRRDRPAEQVRHRNQVGGYYRPVPAAERPAGEHPQRRDRQREENGLRH